MRKRVVQFSIDVASETLFPWEIVKILEERGYTVLQAETVQSWNYDDYMKGHFNEQEIDTIF